MSWCEGGGSGGCSKEIMYKQLFVYVNNRICNVYSYVLFRIY